MDYKLPVTERARNARMSLRQQSDAAVARLAALHGEKLDALAARQREMEARP